MSYPLDLEAEFRPSPVSANWLSAPTLGGGLSGSNQPIISKTGVNPWFTGSGGTKTITDPVTGEKTTLTIAGNYTPTECNSKTESDGVGGAKGCCSASKGFWYQDYGIFAPLFPDKSAEYCHETDMNLLQVPLNQEIIIGSAVAGIVGVVAFMLYKKRK